MKKFLALALALAMIFSLCACGETATTATEAPKAEEAAPAAEEASAKTEYKVGVAIYQFDDNFMTLYRNELESYMKSLETDDMKFDITIVDGKNDMAEQTNQINNFITQGMDAIILNLVQTSSADSVIDSIVAAGIPCILINREPLGDNGDESYKGILDNAGVCYVGADARQSGTFQGEIVAELPNHGDINGDGKISYIMIEGDPENVDAQYRTEFSVKALTDAGYEVECLDDQVGNWAQAKGQEITSTDLAKFGEAVEVVFCNNDAMALGAAAAIEAAGRVVGQDIYLLGVDALDECVEMVNNGTMTGTVLNDHIGQSHAAVDAAVKALKGEALENYYWVDYVKVAAEATEAAAPAAEPAAAEGTIYVLGPTPDHGWTAQAGAYAQAKCDELTAAGNTATYISASSGEEQVDQINTIIANGDASIVVMMALDDSAQAGQEALHAEGIPFISFDRIIEATEAFAALNYSGNNWQCGAGIAYWLQKNGLKAGDTVVVLYGDNGTVCSRRQEGFEQFLRGELKYEDEKAGTFETTEKWEQADIDKIFNGYTYVCDWSADGAYGYIEQKLDDIVAEAKENGNKLYIYSMDDEMTFGVLNYLEAGASEATLADFENMEVYISAIGGMQELYDVMNGSSAQSELAAKYFDDMMSVYFSPKMMQTVIGMGVDYVNGNWDYEVGSGSYEPVFIVDKDLAGEVEGFTGH